MKDETMEPITDDFRTAYEDAYNVRLKSLFLFYWTITVIYSIWLPEDIA